MLLDEDELLKGGLLEEKTISRLRALTTVWLVFGILLLIACYYFIRLLLLRGSPPVNYLLLFYGTFLLTIVFSVLLIYFGYRSRKLLNVSNHAGDLEVIANRGIIIWSIIFLLSVSFSFILMLAMNVL